MSRYFHVTRSPVFSFAVTAPLLLLYNLVYFLPGNQWLNGVDFIGYALLTFTGAQGFLIFNLLLFLITLGIFLFKRKKGIFSFGHVLILFLESAAYGLASGMSTVYLMKHMVLLGPHKGLSLPMALIVSAGAGYHEELFFRLVLLGIPMLIISRLKKGLLRVVLSVLLVTVNAVLFSLAHFLGRESFTLYAFYFRMFTGLWFCLIFLIRGFAVSAYTHFFYDVMVFLS